MRSLRRPRRAGNKGRAFSRPRGGRRRTGGRPSNQYGVTPSANWLQCGAGVARFVMPSFRAQFAAAARFAAPAA